MSNTATTMTRWFGSLKSFLPTGKWRNGLALWNRFFQNGSDEMVWLSEIGFFQHGNDEMVWLSEIVFFQHGNDEMVWLSEIVFFQHRNDKMVWLSEIGFFQHRNDEMVWLSEIVSSNTQMTKWFGSLKSFLPAWKWPNGLALWNRFFQHGNDEMVWLSAIGFF
jgi:hypothetical protein